MEQPHSPPPPLPASLPLSVPFLPIPTYLPTSLSSGALYTYTNTYTDTHAYTYKYPSKGKKSYTFLYLFSSPSFLSYILFIYSCFLFYLSLTLPLLSHTLPDPFTCLLYLATYRSNTWTRCSLMLKYLIGRPFAGTKTGRRPLAGCIKAGL